MVRPGIGLKPLIALQLIIVVSVCAALVSLAAVRLYGHGFVGQLARHSQLHLTLLASSLQQTCPDLNTDCVKNQFQEWIVPQQEGQEPVQALSLIGKAGAVASWSGPAVITGNNLSQGSFEVTQNELGQPWLLVEAPIDSNFRLRAAFSMNHLDLTRTRLSLGVILYAALVTGALILLGWILLFRSIVRPVDKLLQLASQVSEQGDLSFFLGADSGSELGRLGLSLGRMARRIEDDQTKLKSHISRLEELNRDLHQAQMMMIRQEKLASVGLLAAGLAHEVGNPMAAILGYIGMLRTEEVDPNEQQNILQRVEREAERIDRIIRDLLAYSRPSKGEVLPCSPQQLVEDAAALLRSQKKFKHVHVKLQLQENLPLVACDPDLVRQVLVNLLFNSMHAVSHQGHIWISVACAQRDQGQRLHWPNGTPDFFSQDELHQLVPPREGRSLPADKRAVIFAVIDDGPGIPKKNLVRIFDPFFTSKEPGQGTGLGLSLCQTAVQSMDGEIWVYSIPGQGTQLAFWLPEANQL